jgi:hypothetical protein
LKAIPVQPYALRANVAGFSLHAGQAMAADQVALERLCRYGFRAPFSQERLSRAEDGRVIYELRRPWPDGSGDPASCWNRWNSCGAWPRWWRPRGRK